jgi:Zn-dependent peptidase ImmA (M78 family)
MALDLKLVSDKLRRYREQFQVSIEELANSTGIDANLLKAYEVGEKEPTGDEILVLADYYKADFKFFISNERIAPFEQTETLFRMHGGQLSKADRWTIQEFLFLAECEAFLQQEVEHTKNLDFAFVKKGTYYKQHGIDAAHSLREKLGYAENVVPLDIYRDFRSIGIHVFRRRLENSNVSGLFIKHPVAGKCILVNYTEDVYRQRFTAAHEAAHAILDGDNEDVIISFTKWKRGDLKEIRANSFASSYLMPRNILRAIPNPQAWDKNKAIHWANQLKVSTTALANALLSSNLVSSTIAEALKAYKVPQEVKSDPEISATLSSRMKERKRQLLQQGLSNYYVKLCFEAYRRGIITAARLGEMTLVTEIELHEIIELYGEKLSYGN